MAIKIAHFMGGNGIYLATTVNPEYLIKFIAKHEVCTFDAPCPVYGNDGTEMLITSAPISDIKKATNCLEPIRYGDFVNCPDENCGGYIVGPNGVYRYEKVR